MNGIKSREIRLASRPTGMPSGQNFAMAEVVVPPPEQGHVLVRNLYMSVDPYMRGRMNDAASYVQPFQIGSPLDGGAVGEVVESRAPGFAAGDVVLSNYGWREYFAAPAERLRPLDRSVEPLSLYLGALGMPGMTAWVGLRLAEIKAGETVFVSGAAGAVGHVAGQLGRIYGCRTIGSAGSPDKVTFLRDVCRLDAAFDYKSGRVRDFLKQHAPDGIDVYFDNVGGETLEAALSSLRVHGRIIACGSISGYNGQQPRRGITNLFFVTTKRLTMKGLIVSDHVDKLGEFEAEVGGYLRAGTLKTRETVVAGLDQAVSAFIGLFEGRNVGKMVVAL